MLAAVLAACGGDDGGSANGSGSPSAPASGNTLEIGAFDKLEFDRDSYTAKAGEITFAYENEGSIPHTLLVDGHEDDLKLKVSSKGDTDEGSITLEPGDYVIYCDVSGHRGGGMEADLTVE